MPAVTTIDQDGAMPVANENAPKADNNAYAMTYGTGTKINANR